MRSSTAAALVGAGALSTLAGPLHRLHLRRDRRCAQAHARAPIRRRSRQEPRRGVPRNERTRCSVGRASALVSR